MSARWSAAAVRRLASQLHLPHGYWSAGLSLLRHWDFRQRAASPAAAYFNVVWRDLLADTFHDELPDAAGLEARARAIDAALASGERAQVERACQALVDGINRQLGTA